MKRSIFPVLALVALVGCSVPVSDPTALVTCGPRPDQWKIDEAPQLAVSHMRLIDPESARITEIRLDGPRKWAQPGGSLLGWQVSFWLYAKNSFGGYAGPRKILCLILPDGSWRAKEANAWNP